MSLFLEGHVCHFFRRTHVSLKYLLACTVAEVLGQVSAGAPTATLMVDESVQSLPDMYATGWRF